MRIRFAMIKVDDQQKAFPSTHYTSVVGFVKRLDVPIGGVRWLTVSSPEGAEVCCEKTEGFCVGRRDGDGILRHPARSS
jgi:hypothetical protein